MKFVTLFLLLFIVSCASTTPGIDSGENGVNQLDAFVEENSFSSGTYRLYVISFKNNSKEWKRIKSTKINFLKDSVNKEAKILVGDDLSTWVKSIDHEKAVSQYNTGLILSAIAVGGMAVASSSSNSTGAYVALGAIAGLVGVGVYNDLKATEIVRLVPKGHLLSPFSVPPGLVTQQWIAIEYHNNDLPEVFFKYKTFQVTVEYLDGKTEVHTF